MKKSSTTLTVGHLQYHPITSSTPTTTETRPLTDTFIDEWMFLVAPRWNPDWAPQGGQHISIYGETVKPPFFCFTTILLGFTMLYRHFPWPSFVQAPLRRTLEKQCSQCRFRCSEAPTMMGPPRHTISFSSAEWSRIASAQSLEPGFRPWRGWNRSWIMVSLSQKTWGFDRSKWWLN